MKTKTKLPEARNEVVYGLLNLTTLLLSLMLVLAISVDTFRGLLFYTQPAYLQLQFWICLLFLFEFVVELLMAPRKWHFMATHFIFLLVAIPYHNIFMWMGLEASPEVAYVIRFAPLLRGAYAMFLVVGWFTRSRIAGFFVTYLLTLFACIYFSSLVFYMVELGVNGLVHGYGDALWWAFMDATTVGSNIIAVTPVGKVLSVLLAAVGMMMFPIFTVYVTNLVEKSKKE